MSRKHPSRHPSPADRHSPAPGSRGTAWGFVLLLLTAFAYLPAIRCGFVWDDDYMLLDNPLVKSSTGLWRIWFSTDLRDYFPLTSTSFWLEWRLWGPNAAGYHGTNLLLHAFSALVLWRVLERLRFKGAWLVAALFAVHPVNVESVAWITERKNTLAMFFFSISLLCYLRFEAAAGTSDGARMLSARWYSASLAAFLFALLSKTAVVAMPILLLFCAWWQRGRISRQDWIRSAPFFVLALVLGLVTVWFQYQRAIGTDVVQTAGPAARLAGAGWAVWFYLFKALAPVDLSFVYPRREINAASPIAWLPLLALSAALGVLWHFRHSWGRALLFGLGWFVLMLLPVLGFLNIYFHRFSLVADHWQYFSLVGVLTAVIATGLRILDALSLKSGIHVRAVAFVLLAAMTSLTWQQSRHYRDAETLWRHTLDQNPACWLAHNNLGILIASQGRADEALHHYQQALRFNPGYAEAHYNQGNALVRLGRLNEAIPHYQAAARIAPHYAAVHANLGFALAALERYEEAVACYREAARRDPDSAAVHNNLGATLARLGRIEEAIASYQAALQIDPQNAETHAHLGDLFAHLGRTGEAVRNYESAVRLSPGHAHAQRQLKALRGTPE